MTRSPGQPLRDCHLYLWNRANHQACGCSKNYDQARKKVKDWLTARDDQGRFINGETDDAGNQIYWFPKPITSADDVEYAGVMLKASPGNAFFDEEEVMGFARAKGLAKELIKTVEVVDEEQLFVLYQEGVISEEELRGLTHYPAPTYTLWPVKTQDALDE